MPGASVKELRRWDVFDLMYSRYKLETALSVPQVLERLGRVIRPRHSRWEAVAAGLSGKQEPVAPFVGRIDGDRFTIRRAIPYRNDFRPLLSGHVVPVGSGARIDIVLRLSVPVALVIGVWLALSSVAAAAGLWDWIRTSNASGLLALALPLFGCGLVAVGSFLRNERRSGY